MLCVIERLIILVLMGVKGRYTKNCMAERISLSRYKDKFILNMSKKPIVMVGENANILIT